MLPFYLDSVTAAMTIVVGDAETVIEIMIEGIATTGINTADRDPDLHVSCQKYRVKFPSIWK